MAMVEGSFMITSVRLLILDLISINYQISGCSNFAEPGFRLAYGIVRETLFAQDAADCENQCLLSTRFTCKTFAYKYASSGVNNCELSNRDFRDIQRRTDLDPDRDWDVFERTRYSGECKDKSGFYGDDDSIIIDRLGKISSIFCFSKK